MSLGHRLYLQRAGWTNLNNEPYTVFRIKYIFSLEALFHFSDSPF